MIDTLHSTYTYSNAKFNLSGNFILMESWMNITNIWKRIQIKSSSNIIFLPSPKFQVNRGHIFCSYADDIHVASGPNQLAYIAEAMSRA